MADTRTRSDLSRAFSEDGTLKTHVGGQALLEGIMMRGKYNWAVAVREPAGGIYTEEHELASGKDKNSWLYWPFIRGCRAFVESLTLGYKALSIAAEHAFVEEAEQEGPEASRSSQALEALASSKPAKSTQPADEPDFSWMRDFGNPDEMIDALGAQRSLEIVSENADRPDDFDDADSRISADTQRQGAAGPANDAAFTSSDAPKPSVLPTACDKPENKPLLGNTEMALSMVMGLVLGIALFIVAPAFITNLIVGEYDDRTLLWNIVDGVLRIAVFVFYIWLIGRMSDIKRMFGYHGAEHKTIHCFEHGLPLTPDNARSFPRLHVRCGTAFLIMVMIIAIFVYTITPLDALIAAWGVADGAPKLALVIAVRILLMPVIAGVAYEITVKWAGSHPENPLVKVILWPGMQMQYLTTREPDDGQIECAIAAMQLVLDCERQREPAA